MTPDILMATVFVIGAGMTLGGIAWNGWTRGGAYWGLIMAVAGWVLATQVAHAMIPEPPPTEGWQVKMVNFITWVHGNAWPVAFVILAMLVYGAVIARDASRNLTPTGRPTTTDAAPQTNLFWFAVAAAVAIVGFLLWPSISKWAGVTKTSQKTELVKLAERAEKFQKANPKYKLNPQVSPFYISLPGDMLLTTDAAKQEMSDKVDSALNLQTKGEMSAKVKEIQFVEIQGTKDNKQIEFYVVHYKGVLTTNGVEGKESNLSTIVPISLTDQEVNEMAAAIARKLPVPNEGTRPSDAPADTGAGESTTLQRAGQRLILRPNPNFKPE